MAVARMMKVSAIGHSSVLDRTIESLQRAGVVEIVSQELAPDAMDAITPDRERVEEYEIAVADAVFVRDLLGRFHTHDAPFSAFISEKIHLSAGEFDALTTDAAFAELYRECQTIAERLAGIGRERVRLHELTDALAPWEGLRLQISQWKGTEHVVLFTGTVPERASAEIRQALRDTARELSIAEVGSAQDCEAWVVMAHRDSVEEVRATLLLTEFEEVGFPGLEDYPAEERSRALEALAALDAEEREVAARATELAAEYYSHVTALVQAMLTRKDAEEVRARFLASERAFVVTGWVPERRHEQLAAALSPVGAYVDLSFEKPDPDDTVPVELVNPGWLRPFEVLTDLYGRPRYGEIDPTPLLAGFFFLFFGICIGDFGYGVMLSGGAWLVKHRLDVAPGVRKFMDLVMLGGVASMIVGVATRSYFALSEAALPGFLRYEPIIHPLDQLQLFLILSVALGIVQVSFGVFVNAYRKARHGDIAGAVFEDLTTIGLFIAVGASAYFALGAATTRPDLAGTILMWAFALAVVLKGRVFEELLFRRSLKGALLGVGKGLLGLYGLVGYASDFLSYTRLAALGLASLLVGDVMNRLAGLASGIPWGIGLLMAALILIVGHTFNVLINLLGGFIHSMRLQFVEFFSKFYAGGGRAFAPFALRTKSVVLHPDPGEPKGGV